MATTAKDPKPVCKYGATCYRKSEQHLKQYQHPKRTQDNEKEEPAEEVKPKRKKTVKGDIAEAQTGTIEQYFKPKNTKEQPKESEDDASTSSATFQTSAENSEKVSLEEKSVSDDEDRASDEDTNQIERPASPTDVRENIKSKFLVGMPEDFYDFWQFCKKVNPEDPLVALQDTLGFTLVGPYDVLASRHKDVDRNSTGHRPNFLLHWRYYYDPPEFLTVIKGDDKKQFHLGYFRDVPSEMPVFVAANNASENGTISPKGSNLFAAVSFYITEQLKQKNLPSHKKKSLQELQEKIKSAASDGGYSLELKTPEMKERDKKVVCKTFHAAGLVVPVDDNEVGYRPVPETPGDLKKMFTKILDSKTEAERDKHMEPLQEIITLVQFANDECDYGEGLELGLDLFTFGGKCFHSVIGCLLTLGYQLVGRPEFSKIIEAHLKMRSHSADLSQID